MEPLPTGHPRRWAILGVLVVSLLVVVLDNTVLNVALRTIADPRHGLGASQSDLEWAVNSYTLVFAGLLFTWGTLGDRFGRRRVLTGGLALFAVASLASAYAQSPAQLIGARALMGIGGAAVLPATLSIISNVFPVRERGRAIGIWAGAVGLAVAIGPVLGGALLERYWWGSVFLINLPIVAVGLLAIAAVVPESRAAAPGRPDLPGVLATIVGLVALVYGIIEGGEHGFGRTGSWGLIVVGLAVLAAFVAYERQIPNPSLDVRLFREARFSAAVAATALVFFAAMGTFFFSSFYLQLVRGYSPLSSGLLLLPFAAAQLLVAPRSAALVGRFGPRYASTMGMIAVIIGVGSFGLFTVDTPIWLLCVGLFVQGVGMAIVVPSATESIVSALPPDRAGVGSAVANTVRQVGGALGVAVLGSVLSATYRADMIDATAGLPAGAASAARESVSGGYAVAATIGGRGAAGERGEALIGAVNDAFVAAMHAAAWGGVAVASAGLVVVATWLPRRALAHAVRAVPGAPAEVGEPALVGRAPAAELAETA